MKRDIYDALCRLLSRLEALTEWQNLPLTQEEEEDAALVTAWLDAIVLTKE